MEKIESLLSLPIETLITLAFGYFGYRLTYLGRDQGHKSVDVVFYSLIFGLIASLVLRAGADWPIYLVTLAAFLIITVVALAAQKYLLSWAALFLRYFKLSIMSGPPNVWNQITSSAECEYSQIIVYLKNGRGLLCRHSGMFEDAPFGPAQFGEDGSIALYPTHFRAKSGDEWSECADVIDTDYGWKLTYLHADDIERVDLRLK